MSQRFLFKAEEYSGICLSIHLDIWVVLSFGWGFPGGSDSKESACTVGDPGLGPGLGRSSGEGNGYPSGIAWRCPWSEEPVAHGVSKSWTQVSD